MPTLSPIAQPSHDRLQKLTVRLSNTRAQRHIFEKLIDRPLHSPVADAACYDLRPIYKRARLHCCSGDAFAMRRTEVKIGARLPVGEKGVPRHEFDRVGPAPGRRRIHILQENL
jgi:hypothetical protein